MKKIGIIDYGISNLMSVNNAFEALGIPAEIINKPTEFVECSHLVLPGVGSYIAGMTNLQKYGLDEAIYLAVKEGKPILGLCLGMQLLSLLGEEFGYTKGLGLIADTVIKLPRKDNLKSLHIGWNEIEFKRESKLFNGIPDNSPFYFAHGYCYTGQKEELVTGTFGYGQDQDIVAFIEQNNLFGAQCHPEKSQAMGLKYLKNFSEIC